MVAAAPPLPLEQGLQSLLHGYNAIYITCCCMGATKATCSLCPKPEQAMVRAGVGARGGAEGER